MYRFRLIPAVLATAMAAFPFGSAWTSAHAATAARPTSTLSAAQVKKFKGPAVTMRWGPVQVTIGVSGKKIVSVWATAPMDRPRSAFINRQALPLLKQELLQAQSAGVAAISGATMTSDAYARSLQAALHKAGI
jgi:uncharacterized protein with FMN-binding domain